MALQPSLSPLIVAGNGNAPHTLEVYLDFVCPYSAKMSRTIDSVITPLISSGGKYDCKVKVIFRPQIQPWHASSMLTHEAALAALRASPDQFWTFSRLLFDHQEEFFDRQCLNLTIQQIRDKLTDLASQVLSPGKVDEFRDLLTMKGTPNGGIPVTDDLKYNLKIARHNSIHVSPTALWNGLVASEVSSSWAEKEWNEFFASKI
ncbi:hypothetical protein AGABI1DRAFT_84473 [Agaricus bisporus var. burnettii JB137-S8]|uniref:Thioredoxin-like fold domain-containing protein n=1 Tax=Agaricus bisporus var. burnettii (strain JB137-S8 / ATCC MYA-4627 / FGSC 10392) TaxID=597362 RepID=K5VZM1_AGABU|nr:uncharacterized protein AGABI1DRAFT_84473 [Agaricus bisporus var. burnettii JB137-S8]EKM79969.1 hypothetical protein AGABI1DRAFT_84473 [Agaricus bisporus var. burnettii JB137-S8]